jgi:transcriptional regulator of acetoin/glycerol metabolism
MQREATRQSGRMDLRDLARAGDDLRRARRAEADALDRIARIIEEAAPIHRNLKLASTVSLVPRSTIYRRLRHRAAGGASS